MTSKTVGNQITLYVWDGQNRLLEVDQGASQATALPVALFTYDANGNRVKKVEPQSGKVTIYRFDSNRPNALVVEEDVTEGGVTIVTIYTWGSDGQLISMNVGGQQRYALTDAQGSITALTDKSGNVTDTWAYDSFGNVLNRTGTTVNPFRYTGEYFDDVIGLQYNRARWNDPKIGRFVSIDPFDGRQIHPESLNKYTYAENDPVSNVDPSGLATLQELNTTVSVAQEEQQMNTQFAGQTFKQFAASMCAAAAQFAKNANNAYDKVKKVTGGTAYQAHHVLQNAVMEKLFKTYTKQLGFAIPLLGGSVMKGSPHGLANLIQSRLAGREATFVAFAALRAAGCRNGDATEIVLAATRYSEIMGWL